LAVGYDNKLTAIYTKRRNMLKPIGERIYFAKRSGRIIGHTVCKRISHADKYETYYIVELDPESRGYLYTSDKFHEKPDCFVSMMLVHVGNVEDKPPVVGL
jgi:hypothetical protein